MKFDIELREYSLLLATALLNCLHLKFHAFQLASDGLDTSLQPRMITRYEMAPSEAPSQNVTVQLEAIGFASSSALVVEGDATPRSHVHSLIGKCSDKNCFIHY